MAQLSGISSSIVFGHNTVNAALDLGLPAPEWDITDKVYWNCLGEA